MTRKAISKSEYKRLKAQGVEVEMAATNDKPLHCSDFNLENCGCGMAHCDDDVYQFEVYSPAYERYGSPNLWAKSCCRHHDLIKSYSQRQWNEANYRRMVRDNAAR